MIENSDSKPCKYFERDLVLFYYNELSAAERIKAESHLRICPPCRSFLDGLRTILPRTVAPDEPPPAFWDDYSREMRAKIAAVEKGAAWKEWFSFLHPWSVPAFAAAAVVILALTLTLGRGVWRPQQAPPADEALMEILPIAEDLEFFKAMEVLDAMDLLESWGGPANGMA